MAVSIQQAATNAFVAYLAAELPDVRVEGRWPPPDRKMVTPAITVVPAGRRQDTPIDMRVLSKANTGTSNTRALIQIAACYQPYQLDVWTTGHLQRDDLMARLDALLRAGETALTGVYNPDPLGHSVLVAVADGWEESSTTADFTFEEPDIEDLPNSVEVADFRAIYRGGAHFVLTLPVVVARQKVGKISLLLDGDTDRTELGT